MAAQRVIKNLIVSDWLPGRRLWLRTPERYSMEAAAEILRWLESLDGGVIPDSGWKSSGFGRLVEDGVTVVLGNIQFTVMCSYDDMFIDRVEGDNRKFTALCETIQRDFVGPRAGAMGCDDREGSSMRDRMIEIWSEAARDLGLEIDAPFSLVLENGARIDARLRLRSFGGPMGILVVTDYSTIAPFADEIVSAGFGFSTLSEEGEREHYDREVMVEMLRDWDWYGPEELRPEWCLPVDDAADDSEP